MNIIQRKKKKKKKQLPKFLSEVKAQIAATKVRYKLSVNGPFVCLRVDLSPQGSVEDEAV